MANNLIDLENKYSLLKGVSPLIPFGNKDGYFVKQDNANTDDMGNGGTKLRKLEYLLWSLKEKYNIKTIESYGAYGSYHLLTLGYWAKKYGMNLEAKIWSQPVHIRECRNLLKLKKIATKVDWICSMQVPFLPTTLKIKKEEKKAYVPIGGDLISGAFALYNGIYELDKQIDLKNAVIITAAGTCASVAGLLAGAVNLNKGIKILAVNITSRFYSQRAKIISTAKELLKIRSLENREVKNNLDCCFGGEELHFVEYGRVLSDFNEYDNIARKYGINVDPTYTSKSFKAFYNYKKKEEDGNVIYWHSKP